MNIAEMYPSRYLRGQDLTAPILIVIMSIGQEKMRAGAGKPEETKWVLRFQLTKEQQPLKTTQRPPEGYGLPMRKTLAHDIAQVLHETNAEKWIGQKVVIYPVTETAAGRDVVTTHARAPKTPAKEAHVEAQKENA